VLNIYIVGGTALLMICLGIALEVALHISNTQNGMYAHHSLAVHQLTPSRLLSTSKECVQLPINPVPYGNTHTQYIVTIRSFDIR
jgi:hypothetical protein